jgi:alpha-glucosidase (family GH31 glycosyl hydrolase)
MYQFQQITKNFFEDNKGNSPYHRRPLIMANVDGIMNGIFERAPNIASHRYSIAWTGDTSMSSAHLRREITNIVRSGAETATPYISSDIAGFLGNPTDNQWSRWSQYATMSPIFRFHGANAANRSKDRHPEAYGAEAQTIVRDYINMRYRLLPLFYSLSRENYDTGLPLTRRLDFNYPKYPESRDSTQYTLGNNILVAPLWEWSNESPVVASSRNVFIPDGRWIDVWTGISEIGPKTISVTHDNKTSPIFVRSGSVIPLIANAQTTADQDWGTIILDVYPSNTFKGEATLYEDDANTIAYQHGHFRKTSLSTSHDGATGETIVNISAANGTFPEAIANRAWKIRVHAPASWGALQSTKLNGRTLSATKLNRNTSAYPFAVTGSSPDADVYELTAPSSTVITPHEVRFKFATPQM